MLIDDSGSFEFARNVSDLIWLEGSYMKFRDYLDFVELLMTIISWL